MTDTENPEWTAQMFTEAKPAREVLPDSFFEEVKRLRGQRGKQKAPKKVPVSLRLDAEIVDAYKATGKGWQSRINDVLLSNLPAEDKSYTRIISSEFQRYQSILSIFKNVKFHQLGHV